MYASGKKVREIVEYFGNNGVLSSQKKPLTKTSVNTILQNRKYIGEYQYRDVVVPDGMLSIVSKELFALVQHRIVQNKYALSASRSEFKYLLTGKLICGNCGAVYAGESGTGRTGEKCHYYKCVKASVCAALRLDLSSLAGRVFYFADCRPRFRFAKPQKTLGAVPLL